MATLQEVVRKKWVERDRAMKEIIINGVPDFSEYRYHIGYLRGMWDLMDDIDHLLKDPDSAEEGR